MESLESFVGPWKRSMRGTPNDDLPTYRDLDQLICTAQPHSFQLGTGASLYTESLIPAITAAQREVILVTCFWAESSTLSALKQALQSLAEYRASLRQLLTLNAGPGSEELPPLRVRICFSSRSLFQKLFHTTSRDGYVYPPELWQSQLGLPDPEILSAGNIDLEVKTLFFLPFSVMHPKFLIIDGRRAWLPSCNVSWEPWLEGCIEVSGEIVPRLRQFYQRVWEPSRRIQQTQPELIDNQGYGPPPAPTLGLIAIHSPATHSVSPPLLPGKVIPTILLPSSHHRDPQFRPLPWQENPLPPSTPLNNAIIHLIDMARSSVYIHTPNLTSYAVIEALLNAMERGVNVTVVTSRSMMVLEQILTSGTTTAMCLRSFIQKYVQLGHKIRLADLEEQRALGNLDISYFKPRKENLQEGFTEEPVHSHIKLSIIDEQWTVLGSGNMDRASWFTSQELGIMFHSKEFANSIRENVRFVLRGRLDSVYNTL